MATLPTVPVASTVPQTATQTYAWPSAGTQFELDYGPDGTNIPLLPDTPHANQLELRLIRYGFDADQDVYNIPKSLLYFNEALNKVYFPAYQAQNPASSVVNSAAFTSWAGIADIWTGYPVPNLNTTEDFPVLFRSTFSDTKAVTWVATSRVTGSQLNLMTEQLLALIVEQVYDADQTQLNVWDRGAKNGVASLDTNATIPIAQLPPGAAVAAGIFIGVFDNEVQGRLSKYTDDNATTYTLLPAASGSNIGSYVVASVDITAPLTARLDTDGISSLLAGDRVISDGTLWSKVLKEANGIGPGQITSDMILNGTIAAVDLASDAVETAKILNAAVTTAKLGPLAVETANINADQITFVKLKTVDFTSGTTPNRLLVVDANADLALSTFKPSQLDAPVAPGDGSEAMDMNNNAILNVPNSGLVTDAASRQYVIDQTNLLAGNLIQMQTWNFDFDGVDGETSGNPKYALSNVNNINAAYPGLALSGVGAWNASSITKVIITFENLILASPEDSPVALAFELVASGLGKEIFTFGRKTGWDTDVWVEGEIVIHAGFGGNNRTIVNASNLMISDRVTNAPSVTNTDIYVVGDSAVSAAGADAIEVTSRPGYYVTTVVGAHAGWNLQITNQTPSFSTFRAATNGTTGYIRMYGYTR